MKVIKILLIVVGLCYAVCAKAYEVINHYDMSFAAVTISNLSKAALLTRLGTSGIDDPNQVFPSSPEEPEELDDLLEASRCLHGTKMEIHKLIACGAMFEDSPGKRSLNHFYEEQYGGRGVTLFGITAGLPSPDWILADGAAGDNSAQHYSYLDAQKYYYQALTATTKDDWARNWGLTFQSLGQVIHHIEDMAQPQHVRNEEHCDSIAQCTLLVYNPSLYEKWPKKYPSIISDIANRVTTAVFDRHSSIYAIPRDFWDSSDGIHGLARYTSTNWVSAGTNFRMLSGAIGVNTTEPYPQPALPFSMPIPIGQVYADLGENEPAALVSLCASGVDCSMTMIKSTSNKENVSSLSIFDNDITARKSVLNYFIPGTSIVLYQTDRIFSLNHANYLAAYHDLVPLAVSHAAGLINYFFRGELTISAPLSGVFGAIDVSDAACATGECGFKQLKVSLQNANADEPTSSGKMTAIVSYHVNTCFKADFSQQYKLASFGLGCRSSDESRVISKTTNIDSIDSASQRDYPFDFSASPIPLNATDVKLQVVYQGVLGGERNGIAVGQLDISEPTGFPIENNRDYGIYLTQCNPVQGYSSPTNATNAVTFDITFNAPIAPFIHGTLNAGEHAMLAYLAPLSGVNITVNSNLGTSSFWNASDVEQIQSDSSWTSSTYRRLRSSWVVVGATGGGFVFESLSSVGTAACVLAPVDYAFIYPAFATPLKAVSIQTTATAQTVRAIGQAATKQVESAGRAGSSMSPIGY